MKEFLQQNMVTLIIAAVIFVVAVILWFVGKGKYRGKAKQLLLALVVAAEEKYGGGTGEIKFAYVAQKLYEIMPAAFQWLFTPEKIAEMIEEAVTKMKEILSTNNAAAALIKK